MAPGQMSQKPALGGERKMKSGNPSIKMSTGGSRKMKPGNLSTNNAEGTKVAALKEEAKKQKKLLRVPSKKERVNLAKNYLSLAVS